MDERGELGAEDLQRLTTHALAHDLFDLDRGDPSGDERRCPREGPGDPPDLLRVCEPGRRDRHAPGCERGEVVVGADVVIEVHLGRTVEAGVLVGEPDRALVGDLLLQELLREIAIESKTPCWVRASSTMSRACEASSTQAPAPKMQMPQPLSSGRACASVVIALQFSTHVRPSSYRTGFGL